MQPSFDSTVKTGTAAGTMLIILANIYSEDVIRTALLAAVGAAVSFGVSLLLKAIANRWQKS
ncbi:hypothetical protein [Flavisolibacter ginsenosidimutans]|uniref:Holin n=1 Tax=Flavisolibacter ginsenosidimutans TaxID=661481 RepID=A0A5B8UJ06_9BACT|nr:hypothetical protein [Flavisolibacter ginsenosidimutans]QEC56681.1 hypothetical protein FSB75_12500 [Flavisolibacter ginsenosidimutans]